MRLVQRERISALLRRSPVAASPFRRVRSRQLARAPISSEYRWMYELARPGSWALDVGANVGQTACLLSRAVGTDGRVLALEPLPHVFRELSLATRWSNVLPLPYAAGEISGESVIHLPLDSEGIPQDQLASMFARPDSIDFKIQTRALDDFLPMFDRHVSFVKLDVEGYELEVLRGGQEILSHFRPRVVLEVEQRHQPLGRTVDDVFQFLDLLGYELLALTSRGPIPLNEFEVPRHQLEPLALQRMDTYVNNFVALPVD